MSGITLGIDIGTTSVKTVIVSKKDRSVIATQSKETQANVPSNLGVDGNKQDVPKILSALHNCISRLPKDLLSQVEYIGICGQMHGVTMWNSSKKHQRRSKSFKLDIDRECVSHLYTWQDGRCDTAFLKSLPKSSSHLDVHSGYGCATLFWFARNKADKLGKYNKSGTIQDLVVGILCNNDEVVMSDQNAASWGYFLVDQCCWDLDALREGQFPLQLLPRTILRSGQVAGKLAYEWFGIPVGTTVGVALGDSQCSVYALLRDSSDAVLNISTSAQLAYIHSSYNEDIQKKYREVEYRPYFDGRYLAIAASLNGGNCLATFVKALQQWTLDLGFSVPQSQVWTKLINLAKDDSSISNMKIVPTLLGERHAPEQLASVTDINLDSMQLGQIFRALCSGIIKNMHDMMPHELLISVGIKRIVGNGSGLVRNVVLQKEVSSWYDLPLELGNSGDAALGAAMAGEKSDN